MYRLLISMTIGLLCTIGISGAAFSEDEFPYSQKISDFRRFSPEGHYILDEDETKILKAGHAQVKDLDALRALSREYRENCTELEDLLEYCHQMRTVCQVLINFSPNNTSKE